LAVSRRIKIAAALIVLTTLSYVAALAFPEPFFRYHLDYGRFSIYSTRPIDPAIRPLLDRANALLSRSEIENRAIRQRIFLCNSPAMFARFSPNMRLATARDYVFGNAFIAQCDIRANLAWNSAAAWSDAQCAYGRTRTLSGTIAHETTHTLAARHRGWLRSLVAMPPRWKEEGYADYVAQESPIDMDVATEHLVSGNINMCMQYFDDRMMVTYMLVGKHLTYDQLIAWPNAPLPVLEATRAWLAETHRVFPSSAR
jgi:hypothetical protein